MAHRYFEGKAHALLYAKYRPVPPTALIDRIVNFLKEKYTGELSLAVDVGCGSGQSTNFFAPHFKSVIGTDISQAMIDKANDSSHSLNISYQVAPSEAIPAAPKSVQLVTVSQAAHWFDLPKFYSEGERVLCKDGVMAIYGYEFPRFRLGNDKVINQKLDAALDQFYKVELGGYWAAERKIVDSRYVDFKIPYNDFQRDDSLYVDAVSQVSDLINYITTWSGYQKYCETHGHEKGNEIVQRFQNRIMEILGVSTSPEETSFTKRTSFFLLLARNN